jgi:hypothetical protein
VIFLRFQGCTKWNLCDFFLRFHRCTKWNLCDFSSIPEMYKMKLMWFFLRFQGCSKWNLCDFLRSAKWNSGQKSFLAILSPSALTIRNIELSYQTSCVEAICYSDEEIFTCSWKTNICTAFTQYRYRVIFQARWNHYMSTYPIFISDFNVILVLTTLFF